MIGDRFVFPEENIDIPWEMYAGNNKGEKYFNDPPSFYISHDPIKYFYNYVLENVEGDIATLSAENNGKKSNWFIKVRLEDISKFKV